MMSFVSQHYDYGTALRASGQLLNGQSKNSLTYVEPVRETELQRQCEGMLGTSCSDRVNQIIAQRWLVPSRAPKIIFCALDVGLESKLEQAGQGELILQCAHIPSPDHHLWWQVEAESAENMIIYQAIRPIFPSQLQLLGLVKLCW